MESHSPQSANVPFPFSRDQAVREMVELITEKPCASEQEAWALLSRLQITEDSMRAFGWLGLSTLVAHARRGCRKSAEVLLNHAIGMPDKPFREEVKALDAKAAAERMLAVLLDLGVDPEKARRLVQAKAGAALALEAAREGAGAR